MIKLFRHARKDLMEKNKTGKYLKYAIGEIILVVIGILIALQINNWNIERLERKNEEMILGDLRVEFLENLKDAERVLLGNEGIYNAMSTIQKNIAQKNYEKQKFDSLMYYVFDWFDYTPKPGASNNLINSGNLNLVRNKKLRKLLTLWSGVEDELDDDENLALTYSQDIIIPFIATLYPMSNLEEFDNSVGFYQSKNQIIFTPAKKFTYDIEGIFRNETFQSHISVKKMHAHHNAMECINVVNSCRSILDLIDQEIK